MFFIGFRGETHTRTHKIFVECKCFLYYTHLVFKTIESIWDFYSWKWWSAKPDENGLHSEYEMKKPELHLIHERWTSFTESVFFMNYFKLLYYYTVNRPSVSFQLLMSCSFVSLLMFTVCCSIYVVEILFYLY